METQNNNEIHCKVQYGNEIRRFLLQGSYDAMLDQIREYFGLEMDENFSIKYTDDEGDLVTISSDEELMFAVDLFANTVLRLTISPTASTESCENGPKRWSSCGKWAQKEGNSCGKWAQKEGNSCGKWAQKDGSACGKWAQKDGSSCGKWAQKDGSSCGKWAQKNSNECEKWTKMRAERAECWKAKKAHKAAKCEAKGAKKLEKWETKSAKKAQKWENKTAKKLTKAEKWEAKKANWEAKKEKILADPELRRAKIERINSKLAKLQQRKEWLQTKAVDANPRMDFAHGLESVNTKITRLESFRASLVNPVATSPAPVVVVPFPLNQPFNQVGY